MVSVPKLKNAKPQQWRDAADDIVKAAKRCERMAGFAEDEVAATLKQCWVGDTGESARKRFVKQADDFTAAAAALRVLVRVYDDLAEELEQAQGDLSSALDYARRHDLQVNDSGRVQLSKPVATAPGDDSHLEPVKHAQGIIDEALEKATKADVKAARDLRTLAGLTHVSDSKLVKEAMRGDSPLALAMRLNQGRGGIHPINVSSAELKAVEQAARETGMSKKLLLAILWQEQQWYQNHDPSLRGPTSFVGRVWDWAWQRTILPDKSLGIVHIKPETARGVLENHPKEFTAADGTFLSDLSDSQLTKYIEENPNEAIRLSAYHLRDTKEEQYGSASDKALFTLYAADTPAVRENNEQYGDESEKRGGDIGPRVRNWDAIEPHIDDAMAWERLSDKERDEALKQLESQTPAGHHVSLDPIYQVDGRTTGTGSGSPEPGTPSPSPGPTPTPPES